MAINSLEFKTQLTGELDKAIVQNSATAVFEDNVLRTKFVGTKTVLIPEMDMQSLGTYNRDDGFVQGAVSVTNEPYKLEQDRGRTFMLDREDEDETGVANLAGQVLGEFVRTKVVPEVDAYVLSKLGGYAASVGQTIEGDPATKAYAMFNEAITNAHEAAGYNEELISFVTGDFLRNLENSPEIQRSISISNFKRGGVDTQVKVLNNVKLLPVPAARMKTAYTFFDGTSDGQKEGGFAPTAEAKSIGFIILPKRACSLVKKSETIRTFTPEQNLKADAWKFDYRLYYDAFIKKMMRNAIYAYVY